MDWKNDCGGSCTKCCLRRYPGVLAPACGILLSKSSFADTCPTELQARVCDLAQRPPHVPWQLQLDDSSRTDCKTYDDIRRRCWTRNCEGWYLGSRGSASAPQTSTCLLESVHIMAVYYKLRICNSHATFTFLLISMAYHQSLSILICDYPLLSAVEEAWSVVGHGM